MLGVASGIYREGLGLCADWAEVLIGLCTVLNLAVRIRLSGMAIWPL